MRKEQFLEGCRESLEGSIKVFKQMEGMRNDNSMEHYCTLFGMPVEPNCVQFMQRVRNIMQSINSYWNGVKHLRNEKFPAIAKIDYDRLLRILEVLENLDIKTYKEVYLTMLKTIEI